MSDVEEDVGGAGEDEFEGLPEEEAEFEEGGEGEEGDEGEDGSADSSEEEEGSEQNEYEEDGFLVDNVEEDEEGEGEASDQEAVKKKRKKRRRANFALDEEDYMLLEDNQIRVRRPEEQRKRLKRKGDQAGEKASGAKQLQNMLFGTGGDLEDELADLGPEGGGDEPEDREDERRNRYDDFTGVGSDDMGDFIVGGEDGEKRRARRDARVAQAAGLTTAAVQAANRMFGNFGELMDLHQSHRYAGHDAADDEDIVEEEEGLDEEGIEDEEELERRRLERQEKVAAKKQERLLQHVDPELVDSHFLRPHDHTIRATDLPERLQLLGKSVLEGLPDDERQSVLQEAARWVTDHLFGPSSQASKVRLVVEDGVLEVTGTYGGPSAQPDEPHLWPPWMLQEVDHDAWLDLRNNRAIEARRGRRHQRSLQNSREQNAAVEAKLLEGWRKDAASLEGLKQSVRSVLEAVFDKHEEIPVLAMFRKEACGELLSVRETDVPETTGNERKQQSQPDVRHPRGTIQAKHRRIRRWDVLWSVFNWAVRFFEMYRRRQQRIDTYNKMYDRAVRDEEKDGITSCHQMLTNKVHTAAGMDDIDAKFRHILEVMTALDNLGLENGEGEGGRKGPKRPGRPNMLRRYLQRGLGDCAREVFLSMEQFSENLDRQDAVNLPEEPALEPEEWAQLQIEARGLSEEGARVGDVSTAKGFIRVIKEIIATELAAEPSLRHILREEVYKSAVLSTKPTPAGEDVLDPFHPFGIAKHLVDKKVSSFEDSDTWLRVMAAEKAGLIKVDFKLPEGTINVTLDAMSELYVSDNISKKATAWNEWRKEVMMSAVQDKLVPQLLQELRGRLTANAIETMMGVMQDRFWQFVSQPPVRIMEVPDEQETEPVPMETPRFMAVVWGSGGQGDGPTTIVQLDGQGNLKDLLTAAQLSGNVPRTVNSGSREQPVFDPAADPKKSRDSHKLREKILEHKPNAILVATNAPQSKQLKDDMEKISQYTESDARFKDDLLPHLENKRVDVMWADHRLAALWANSAAAKAEFPDYSFLVRMAVGVGRLALDPLAIIATLCGPRQDILSLKLHELQDQLPQETLAQRLEQTLITGVAQVGVDINAMVANTWRQAPLQFVPGLGPRKARALLAAIAAAEDPFVKTRMDLLKSDASAPFGPTGAAEVAQLGPKVYRNAAPFLRVRHGAVAALQNEAEFEALDDARIHPENEALLQVILEEAFPELTDTGAGVDMRTAIESPDKPLQLDLYSVAEANKHLHKLPTLVDMLFELIAPYGEVRLGTASPTDEEAFFLRHGETRDSLKAGRLVEAKVVWVGETEVKVVIQNNAMEAIIPQKNVSSTNATPVLNQLFKPGQVVTARIMAAELDDNYDENMRRRYAVTLSTASKYLQDFAHWEQKYCADVDRAYRPPDKSSGAALTPSRKPAVRRPLQPRPIEHPLWRNKRATEVAAELEGKPAGSALFRPAQKPTVALQLSHIALSIKLADLSTGPLILNVDVKEAANKPARQPRLVTPLRIEMGPGEPEEQFEDLDEVVARYVEPLVDNVKQLMTHRKFAEGDSNNVSNMVRQQLSQAANMQAGAYQVAIDSARPGTGYIAFGAGGPASSIYKEWFNITPKGFFFRKKMCPSVEHVVSLFKQNPNYKKEQKLSGLHAQPGFGHPAPSAASGAPGYGQPAPAAAAAGYGQPYGGYGAQQQQPATAGYGGSAGGYGGYGAPQQQQPYRPGGPPAAAAAAGGYSRPGAPPPAAGGYGAPGAAAGGGGPGGPGGYSGPPGHHPAGYQAAYGAPPGGYQQPYYGQQAR